jgi:hypothetical protein
MRTERRRRGGLDEYRSAAPRSCQSQSTPIDIGFAMVVGGQGPAACWPADRPTSSWAQPSWQPALRCLRRLFDDRCVGGEALHGIDAPEARFLRLVRLACGDHPTVARKQNEVRLAATTCLMTNLPLRAIATSVLDGDRTGDGRLGRGRVNRPRDSDSPPVCLAKGAHARPSIQAFGPLRERHRPGVRGRCRSAFTASFPDARGGRYAGAVPLRRCDHGRIGARRDRTSRSKSSGRAIEGSSPCIRDWSGVGSAEAGRQTRRS